MAKYKSGGAEVVTRTLTLPQTQTQETHKLHEQPKYDIDLNTVEQLTAFGNAYKVLIKTHDISSLIHDTKLHSKLLGCYDFNGDFNVFNAYRNFSNEELHSLFNINDVTKPVRDYILQIYPLKIDRTELDDKEYELAKIIDNIAYDKNNIKKYKWDLHQYKHILNEALMNDIFKDEDVKTAILNILSDVK